MNAQAKLFILFAGLFVIAVLFGGIQSCRLSDIERTSGAIADQNKRLAYELDVLTSDLDNTEKQLEESNGIITGIRRELTEKTKEFERIIKSSDDLTEQGERRFEELERGLRDAKEIIRSKNE
jgi:predicted  nucleic acid-binding Zn-ribbon protein